MLRFEAFLVEESKGAAWHRDHPISHHNIVDHFKQATASEKAQGLNWYRHAHQVATQVSKDTGHPLHTVAGLIGNYSPQTDWHTNIHTAARVAKSKIALGGKHQEPYEGRKIFAGEGRRKSAERILKGEHWENVLSGDKIRHFTHLVEFGGNKDPKKPRVAIDRHAWSVAAGARMPDSAFNVPTTKKYNKMAGAYIHAANHLNKEARESNPPQDFHIEPHQLQAVTWLVRQRKNNEEDISSAVKTMTKGNSWLPGLAPTKKDLPQKAGWEKMRSGPKERWKEYAKKEHPLAQGVFEGKKMKRFQDFLVEKALRPRSKSLPPVGAGGRKKETEFIGDLKSVGIVDKSFKPAGAGNKADVMTARHQNMEYKADKGANFGQLELRHDKKGWDISANTVASQPETSKWLKKTGFLKQINKQWGKPSSSLAKNYKMGNVYKEVPGVKGIETHYGTDRHTPYIDVGGAGTFRTGAHDPDTWGVPQFGGKGVSTQIRARFKNRGHKAKAGALVNLSIKGKLPKSTVDLGKKKDRETFANRKFGVDYPYEY